MDIFQSFACHGYHDLNLSLTLVMVGVAFDVTFVLNTKTLLKAAKPERGLMRGMMDEKNVLQVTSAAYRP